MIPPLPNLYIPGAPKCGTSALASYLDSRPDTALGRIKEPNFWSNDLPSFAIREGLETELQYRSIFSDDCSLRYRLDASTHYLFSEVATARIVDAVPDARFIVCIRSQVEIAHAWHMQMCNAGYETEPDFETAWNLIPERREGHRVPDRCPEPRLLDYKGVASVGHQIERLLTQVDRSAVHFLRLASLKCDARNEYLAVLEFLDLEDDGRTEFASSNAAHTNRSATLSHLVRHPRIRPWLNRSLGRLGGRTEKQLKRIAKRFLYRTAPRRALSPVLANTLRNTFAEDDRILETILGQGLLDCTDGSVSATLTIAN
ncbi:MAG: hypothetical protein AAFN07_06905 [Pseudomonadota bacterium]